MLLIFYKSDLTLYSIITHFEIMLFGTVMENGAFSVLEQILHFQ